MTQTTAKPDGWMTPPQVAATLGIDPGKVRGWLERGELIGCNLADSASGRPRWRVSQAELDAFLLRRRSQPAVAAPARRRRQPANVIEFY